MHKQLKMYKEERLESSSVWKILITEHLAELQLPSLVDRRLQGYLIEVYKCIRGCYNTKNSFEAHENNITRGNDFKIKKQACRREVRKRFSVYT